MAIALTVSANSASAADFDAEQAIRGLVVAGEVETFSGFMAYGSESGETEYEEDDTQFVSGVLARLCLPLGDNLSIHMDGELEYSSTALADEKQDGLFRDSCLFGGHLSWRNPESSLFGGGNHDNDSGDAERFDFIRSGGRGAVLSG